MDLERVLLRLLAVNRIPRVLVAWGAVICEKVHHMKRSLAPNLGRFASKSTKMGLCFQGGWVNAVSGEVSSFKFLRADCWVIDISKPLRYVVGPPFFVRPLRFEAVSCASWSCSQTEYSSSYRAMSRAWEAQSHESVVILLGWRCKAWWSTVSWRK